MALLSFWKSNREEVLKLSVEQVLGTAGDGNLRDGSECSTEFRAFLGLVPSGHLNTYARTCLDASFQKSGLVLQDLVNEVGRRLEFAVEPGLYQGRRNAVGFDGIWRFKNEPDLVIEVKTSDTYNFSLDTLAEYREKLIADGRVGRETSILIVVGREDTGAFEAQIRGSRHAWDIRLISLESLIRVLQISEKSDDPNTLNQVRQILRPFEYTKVDRIIDVIFETALDVEIQHDDDEQAVEDIYRTEDVGPSGIARSEVEAKRLRVVDSFAEWKKTELVKRSRTLFWTSNKELRVCCAVSKRYTASHGHRPYWYTYWPNWDLFLGEAKAAFILLGCMDRDEAFAIPYDWWSQNKDQLRTTSRPNGGTYWHIEIYDDKGELALFFSRSGRRVPLKKFRFPLG